MAILQVHQAKALKQVHEGSTDPGLMQEMRTATDFALRATKVTERSLEKTMSTMVVQECHLWLNLAEMKDADKARFLDAPISQAGLFGDTVEGFAQQFSAVQQQTEAIQHILPRRDAPSTAAPGARPQSARRRGRPPASSRAAPPQAESTHRPARRASRRRAAPPPCPNQAPSRPGSRRSGPDAGNPEMLEFALSQETARTAPLLPPVEVREENLLFHFVSVPPLVQGPFLPFAAPPQVRRLCRWSRLHSVWRHGSRCPTCLAGSRAQFDSATRFSSPADLPSSTAFSRRRWQSGTPLSCARRLLSSWQRMQSSRSLQPR